MAHMKENQQPCPQLEKRKSGDNRPKFSRSLKRQPPKLTTTLLPCAPRRCIVVHKLTKGFSMPAKRERAGKARIERPPRASVTFPPELYRTLEDLAKKKKVSIAWVVREAAEKLAFGVENEIMVDEGDNIWISQILVLKK